VRVERSATIRGEWFVWIAKTDDANGAANALSAEVTAVHSPEHTLFSFSEGTEVCVLLCLDDSGQESFLP
jgi:hypothetical protein